MVDPGLFNLGTQSHLTVNTCALFLLICSPVESLKNNFRLTPVAEFWLVQVLIALSFPGLQRDFSRSENTEHFKTDYSGGVF